MSPPPKSTIGHTIPVSGQAWIDEPATPLAVPVARTDHELLRDVARDVALMSPVVAQLKTVLPFLVTREACESQRHIDHPGARRWLELAVIVATLLGALAGGWRWLLLPAVERAEAAALASAFPREPQERVVREVAAVPVLVPVDARPPASGVKTIPQRKVAAAKRRAVP
jgi:hypothetical protein